MDATMENKMGLPPPYERVYPNAPPIPGDNPPPNPGFALPPVTVVTQPQTLVLGPQKLGPGPTGAQCPSCRQQIVTRVEFLPNNRTHIFSAALCVLAGCCCGCLVPYCMTSCKTANHYCPRCNAFVGSYIPN